MAQAQNKDCDLCGTYVHIELEYLGEKGCVYCYKEDPLEEIGLADLEWDSSGHFWWIASVGDWSPSDMLGHAKALRRRITELETALTEVVYIFDNGIDVADWDAYEERMRKTLAGGN